MIGAQIRYRNCRGFQVSQVTPLPGDEISSMHGGGKVRPELLDANELRRITREEQPHKT